jgi:hypothetical protein
MVDTLNLQIDRAKRTQGHTQLNRLGVSGLRLLFPFSFSACYPLMPYSFSLGTPQSGTS